MFYQRGQLAALTKLGADPDAGLKYLAMKYGPQGVSLMRPASKLWGGSGLSLNEQEQALLEQLMAARGKAKTPEKGHAALAKLLHKYPQRTESSKHMMPDEASVLEDIQRHLG